MFSLQCIIDSFSPHIIEIINGIHRAKTHFDLAMLNRALKDIPDCLQKESLIKQIDEKRQQILNQ